ncbi:uncharacterized protein FOMMEDRAFT_162143 [Fomitiporia mediterranea MF3/22]|uniref:uncharacterized protein n=1 Tax=Fomitiporia mediterranea (strain MF3/22) TaxID=694068 RepID=UPI0004408F56|nr:uncharacterized protein FOMMEDRAFT_162143 [Fomitiporia mediterranea MF3/22]EJC97809.1 hypothetical protein FOMMEDRAFT_162143 [Fomitiporia mediterranea MF3/22]
MNSEVNGITLEDLIQRVNKLLRFPKSSPARREFAANLSIVALGIRVAYLIDTFSPDEGEITLQRLLTSLRQESSCFRNVRVIYAAEPQQYLFVNMPMLRDRAQSFHFPSDRDPSEANSPLYDTVFVLLDRTEVLIPPPSEVIQIVKQIAESSEDPISLPEILTTKILVPLSGFLLEYPVAYVPSSETSSNFLGGVPLDVYECTIDLKGTHSGETVREHTLLKFSCPAHLAATCTTLEPTRVIGELELRFRDRLTNTTDRSSSLKVTHSVVTQDRMAL